jgi:soluble lytic murein transglycosylase
VRIEQGDHALQNGDWERALDEFTRARQGSSEAKIQAEAQLGIGRTHFFAGNYDAAVSALQELLQDFPDSEQAAPAHFFLGQAYRAQERYTEAAGAYQDYLTLRPGVIDAYVYDLRADALFAAGDYTTAAQDYRAALQAPSLLDSLFIQMKLARSHALAGDYETALALYDDVFARTSSESTKALVLLRKGQVYTTLGQMEEAYELYLQAVRAYPTVYESYSALVALVEAGIPVDDLQRGIVDYFAGQYGVALAAFDRYLQNNPADPGTARYYSALTTRALGGYQGAVDIWDRFIREHPEHPFWAEAWNQKAYTQWAYLDQYTLAIETLLDFVEGYPTHERAPEYLYDAAAVAELSGNLELAIQLWERLAIEYPGYENVRRGLYLSGICQYRLERYAEAYIAFKRAFDASKNPEERSAALFWMGKAQNALGDSEAARQTWQQTAAMDPTGYYSERALDILSNREPFTPPVAYDLAYDEASEKAKAEEWLRLNFDLPADTDLSGLGPLANDSYLQRGSELWRLGLFAEARSEFETLRQALSNDPVGSYRLANYLNEIGLYRSATMAARQVLNLAGMDDATSLSAPSYFNRLRFGTHFADLIIPYGQEYNFHPLFLFSLIRQESLFESFVRSSAAASGLMQIIPSTGEEIARNLGWPKDYTSSDLNRPIVNIRFGVEYLDTQRTRFKGDMYAALAAYNGGPGNAIAWKQLAPDDPDLFLEVIRFEETRLYIRRIYENFSIYRRIYNRTP